MNRKHLGLLFALLMLGGISFTSTAYADKGGGAGLRDSADSNGNKVTGYKDGIPTISGPSTPEKHAGSGHSSFSNNGGNGTDGSGGSNSPTGAGGNHANGGSVLVPDIISAANAG